MAYYKYNFTKAQWEKLESAYRWLLEHNPESNEAKKIEENPENIREIMLDAIENYIAICGLPFDTDDHGLLIGDAVDKYIEKHGGPSFEDCYIIISY